MKISGYAAGLHVVYVSLIMNRIAYCLSAWGGNVKQGDADKINSLFRKAKNVDLLA